MRVFRLSLRTILTIAIVGVSVAAATVVGMLAHRAARSAMRETIFREVESTAQGREWSVIQHLKEVRSHAEILAADRGTRAFLETKTGEIADLQKDLEVARAAAELSAVSIVDANGEVVLTTDPRLAGTHLGEEALVKAGLGRWTLGSLEKTEAGTSLTGVLPMRGLTRGQVVGAIIVTDDAKELTERLTDHTGLGQTGESYLLAPSGLLLSPSRFIPDAELSLKNTNGAHQQAFVKRKEGGGLWLDYRNASVLGFVMKDELQEVGVDWALVVEIDEAEAMASVDKLRDQIYLVGGLVALAALLVGFMLARSVSLPIVALAELSKQIGAGDLTVKIGAAGADSGAEEIGALRQSFTTMTDGLRALLGNVQTGVADMSSRSTQITATARQYSASVQEQATAVAEVSTTIEEIKQTSLSAAESARQVGDAAERAVEKGRHGMESMATAVQMIEVIAQRVQGIAQKILQLSEQTSQIGEIVESVNDLAEQSNLLAVNASIEAAKAGEHGRGFAVVASEVRSLAEQSKRATQQIRSILGEIQKATESAVMATEEGTKRADDGKRTIDAVRVVIQDFGKVLEESADRARQITGAVAQQVSGVSQIADAVGNIAKAGEDNLAGIRQLEEAAVALNVLSGELKTSTLRYQVHGRELHTS